METSDGHISVPYERPPSPRVKGQRDRLGFNILRGLIAVVVGSTANWAAQWAWFSASPAFHVGNMPEYLIVHGVLASVAACAMVFVAEVKKGMIGALWAGIPSVLLMPLTLPLAVYVGEYISLGKPSVPESVMAFLSFAFLFGPVWWSIVLLDAWLPRWLGMVLGAAVLLAVAVTFRTLAARSMVALPYVERAYLGMWLIDDCVPVSLPLAVMTLLGNLSRRRKRAA